MARIFYYLTTLLFLGGCSLLHRSNIQADYIFENINVISMGKDAVAYNKAMAVRDGEIVAIVDQSAASTISATFRVDGESRYLMPGLADMHVHVRWNPQAMFNLFIANGVTTVANMLIEDGKDIDHMDLREKTASGEMLGPRYLISGAHMQGDFPATVEEVSHVLDEHVKHQLDFVKVHGDLPIEIYDALIAGAKERHLRIIGHSQHKMPLKKTLELDALEHMEELLYVSRDQEIVEAMAKDLLSGYRDNVKRLKNTEYRRLVVDDMVSAHIVVDPTLLIYNMLGDWSSAEALAEMSNAPEMKYLPKGVKNYWLSADTNPYQDEFPLSQDELSSNFELMLTLTKELNDSGVLLLLGTDTLGSLVPGYATHKELALLVKAGLSPYEALKTGTVNVAKYLKEEDVSGRIKEGYRADFILLDRNPLEEIANAKSISGVFVQNQWFSRADINELLKSSEELLLGQ